LDESLPMDQFPRFFDETRLNYAENTLSGRPGSTIACISIREAQGVYVEKTWSELTEDVRRMQSALRSFRIREGDRIACLMSVSVPALVILLAAASLGAIYTSTSPDMGAQVSQKI
jgi:acetoacetyl-CoA synthetase